MPGFGQKVKLGTLRLSFSVDHGNFVERKTRLIRPVSQLNNQGGVSCDMNLVSDLLIDTAVKKPEGMRRVGKWKVQGENAHAIENPAAQHPPPGFPDRAAALSVA